MTATKTTFVIVNHDLGFPMYASTEFVEFGSHWSDDRTAATEFVEGEDNPETKLMWFRAVAKLKGYDPAKVVAEWSDNRA
jgi:hypothetical protein